MFFISKIMLFIFLFFPFCSFSASIWDESAKIGYWFYKEPLFSKNIIVGQYNILKNKSKCLNSKQWSLDCGFVDPTRLGLSKEKAFIFEQKEYKALLRDFSMHSSDHRAVLEWQRFNDWVIAQAMAASYSAEFNTVQHPELDSTIAHPFSQFGNLIVKNRDSAVQMDFFKILSKTSLLVFFTRSNCSFCHYQANIVRMLGEKTHIPVWNASLDTGHLPNFNYYLLAPDTVKPAQFLHVSTVPTLFLYLAPQPGKNTQENWIRLATGLTSVELIENRIMRFVQSYQHALQKPVAARTSI